MTTPIKSSNRSKELDAELDIAREQYLTKRPNSVQSFNDATEFMPGGNTRTVLFHGPVPLRIVSGDGCRLKDADDFEYVNFLGEYTAGLFGHNHPIVREAIDQALDKGLNLSGHNPDEIELARLICDRFPSIDRVRFTNSGTEANLLAISTARHFTGRSKTMVFEGGYHGGLLYFRSGNMPLNAPFEYLIADFNDIEKTRQLIRSNQNELACVLIEPMQGSAGCIPASEEFLHMIREETEKSGAILTFDEVMTSRLSSGGCQKLYDIVPDMTTLGKYIGGGMSFGAFGGNKNIMDIFDPRRTDSLPHAGTFNNNTLTMAAGAAAMSKILTNETLIKLNQRGDQLRVDLNKLTLDHNTCIQFTGLGSLLGLHTTDRSITNIRDVNHNNDKITELIFLELLEKGYYIARRGFISLMLTIGEKEVTGFKEAFGKILRTRGDLFQ